jgi:hypothetical protein
MQMKEGVYQVSSTIQIPFHDQDTYVTHEFRPEVLGYLKQGDTFRVLASSAPEDGFVRALIVIGTGLSTFMAAIKIGEGLPAVIFQQKIANQGVIAFA